MDDAGSLHVYGETAKPNFAFSEYVEFLNNVFYLEPQKLDFLFQRNFAYT